jgi:hypothetical protein
VADDPEFEAKLAKFSKSNRHRAAIALMLGAIAIVIGGVGALIFGFLSSDEATYWHSHEYEQGQNIRLMVYGGGAIIVGFAFAWRAIQQWRGRAGS